MQANKKDNQTLNFYTKLKFSQKNQLIWWI